MAWIYGNFQILLGSVWSTLCQMSPYLLFGFLFAGILSVLFSSDFVKRHLGDNGIVTCVKAAILGIPLPLCSCGVIPVAASLRSHGAGKGPTTSFLLSTPQTGVDSIAVTFSLLGPVFAIFRPLAALISGVLGGMTVTWFEEKRTAEKDHPILCEAECCAGEEKSLITKIFKYGFWTLPRDIGPSLFVGILIAGIIATFVPESYFAGKLGQGFTGMLLMLLLGIPLYVCATASVPVAAALIFKGVSPGAALVFLMTGPATNAAAIATIWKIMGRRTTFLYLGSVVISALAAGSILNILISPQTLQEVSHIHEFLPGSVSTASAVILIGVVTIATLSGKFGNNAPDTTSEVPQIQNIMLSVSGMRCSHCAQAIEKELAESPRVKHVRVDLARGTVSVQGENLDKKFLEEKLERLGYKVS